MAPFATQSRRLVLLGQAPTRRSFVKAVQILASRWNENGCWHADRMKAATLSPEDKLMREHIDSMKWQEQENQQFPEHSK